MSTRSGVADALAPKLLPSPSPGERNWNSRSSWLTPSGTSRCNAYMSRRSRRQGSCLPLARMIRPETFCTGPDGACSPGIHLRIEQGDRARFHRNGFVRAEDAFACVGQVHVDRERAGIRLIDGSRCAGGIRLGNCRSRQGTRCEHGGGNQVETHRTKYHWATPSRHCPRGTPARTEGG